MCRFPRSNPINANEPNKLRRVREGGRGVWCLGTNHGKLGGPQKTPPDELEFRALHYRDILTRQHYPPHITYRIRSAINLSSIVNLRDIPNIPECESLSYSRREAAFAYGRATSTTSIPSTGATASARKTFRGNYKSAKLTPNLACISCTSPTRRTRPSASTR